MKLSERLRRGDTNLGAVCEQAADALDAAEAVMAEILEIEEGPGETDRPQMKRLREALAIIRRE